MRFAWSPAPAGAPNTNRTRIRRSDFSGGASGPLPRYRASVPADAIPPRRAAAEHQASRYTGDDGSLMLAAYEGWHADAYWLTFGCEGAHGCQRRVDLGIRPAIERFGRGMTVRGIAKRLRCSACGGRNIRVQITADTRGSFARDRDGPAPETRRAW
jgi:hypothetical protein